MRHSIDFDGAEWVSPAPGAMYKAFVEGNRQARLVEFSEGFLEPDWCRRGHMGCVLDGEMDIDFSGSISTKGTRCSSLRGRSTGTRRLWVKAGL